MLASKKKKKMYFIIHIKCQLRDQKLTKLKKFN